MPENEFEKKVSSEMRDLKFRPSEVVWRQVEERIRRKKKRRVFIIISLLAGLGLLGYWQVNNLFNGQANEVLKIEETIDQKTKNNQPLRKTGEESNRIQNTDETKKDLPNTAEEQTDDVHQKPIDKKRVGREETQPVKQRVVSRGRTKPVQNIKNPIAKINRSIKAQIVVPGDTVTDKNGSLLKKDSLTVAYSEPGPPDMAPLKNEKIAAEKIDESTHIETGIKADIIKKDRLLSTIDSLSKALIPLDTFTGNHVAGGPAKKWKPGVEFTPGIASMNEGLLSFDMAKSADASANPSTGSGVPPALPAGPSPSKAGFGFQLGVVAQNQLTPRSSVSIGIRYGYYGDKISVGRDTLISYTQPQSSFNSRAFYRASNSFRQRINHYHFVEMPVDYQLRLNQNKNKPFIWHGGFTVSRLIASNALMYDSAFGGVYYKNEKWLNKTQFSLSTGISFILVTNRSIQWAAGPALNVHLSSLVDNPFEDKKYLLFAGFRSRILFRARR